MTIMGIYLWRLNWFGILTFHSPFFFLFVNRRYFFTLTIHFLFMSCSTTACVLLIFMNRANFFVLPSFKSNFILATREEHSIQDIFWRSKSNSSKISSLKYKEFKPRLFSRIVSVVLCYPCIQLSRMKVRLANKRLVTKLYNLSSLAC